MALDHSVRTSYDIPQMVHLQHSGGAGSTRTMNSAVTTGVTVNNNRLILNSKRVKEQQPCPETTPPSHSIHQGYPKSTSVTLHGRIFTYYSHEGSIWMILASVPVRRNFDVSHCRAMRCDTSKVRIAFLEIIQVCQCNSNQYSSRQSKKFMQSNLCYYAILLYMCYSIVQLFSFRPNIGATMSTLASRSSAGMHVFKIWLIPTRRECKLKSRMLIFMIIFCSLLSS